MRGRNRAVPVPLRAGMVPRQVALRRGRRAPAEPTRWLTTEEEATSRAVASILVRLPWALECQLQRDAGLSFIEYHALAMLSETP